MKEKSVESEVKVEQIDNKEEAGKTMDSTTSTSTAKEEVVEQPKSEEKTEVSSNEKTEVSSSEKKELTSSEKTIKNDGDVASKETSSTKEKIPTEKSTMNSDTSKQVRSEKESVQTNDFVALDVFKDDTLRKYISTYFDKDGDGKLSEKELSKIKTLYLPYGTKTMEGVKYLTSLETLDVKKTGLSAIDVNGMKNLTSISFLGNKDLKTLDLRNTPNLISAWHSINQEVVYISAGMLNYIGCYNVKDHTGNIVIDLNGHYTLDKNGNKIVNMEDIISANLLSVFKKNKQSGFDTKTNILIIPAGEVKSIFTAGKDNDGNPSKWTFFTNLNALDDIVVTFNSNGGTIIEGQTIEKGGVAIYPVIPIKQGFIFSDWYKDKELTLKWDFLSKITEDLTLFAKWVPEKVAPPKKITQSEIKVDQVSREVKDIEVNKASILPTELPKTGEKNNSIIFVAIGTLMSSIGAIIFRKK
ncbi:InlB B-repeat-containing protein [Vagococcus hydrophili]|uniref:LPXTG cell wall anchor domain-containing protein n=1 Tax=Vagococcus hydrophili TaxID=2714947 RepID=A0A6G8ARU5_9ENTE|nr:InlB B-repeat-containing protein [Vagococcus hydrophili]QIL47645.1 LPXTG cell wall anchor domain-containing protein [Vagococcus hydrophili]